ncbi:DNA-binding transcriptional regulator, MerR family [Acinetobacter marinus]|uniref:DNA-binding transcriptional regulator, MerR family n=1 Tax=Acinetobacter marinus TaxID=281375 RepID=A0A1G6IXL7_9GAMM|nr:MerR family transcriptional regulator [Acinetobacter marinus]SDC10825.1 DNA-binding transcriptional regulator, MerR family [Acinetobacter marinus]
MNISELSNLSGVNAPTIRYYEQIKLLPKAERLSNGYRKYSEEDLKKLFLIKQAQQVGFSLDEIKALIPVNVTKWNHDLLIKTLTEKITEITAMQKMLAENKQNLIALTESIQDKPMDMSCEENANRLMNIYYDESEN